MFNFTPGNVEKNCPDEKPNLLKRWEAQGWPEPLVPRKSEAMIWERKARKREGCAKNASMGVADEDPYGALSA